MESSTKLKPKSKPIRSTSGRETKNGQQLSVKIKGKEFVTLIKSACELCGATVEEFVSGVAVASARLVIQNGGIPDHVLDEMRRD